MAPEQNIVVFADYTGPDPHSYIPKTLNPSKEVAITPKHPIGPSIISNRAQVKAKER